MVYDWVESRWWDRQDARNRGVTADRVIRTRAGHRMRIIFYTDPETGRPHEFLTTEMDLPPGVIAELYRRRWELEKGFAEIKNKLAEKKAWGTGLVAKAAQGQLVALAHNLMVIYEGRLEPEHDLGNVAEDRRREKRKWEMVKPAQRAGRSVSSLRICARGATQRSVKFIRWLGHARRENLTETSAVKRLAHLYATS